ncbi:MAG TPA: alginate export family protein [Novosphingobium sp.]|nr:alginate export family protein [Novosphingobium sp.]
MIGRFWWLAAAPALAAATQAAAKEAGEDKPLTLQDAIGDPDDFTISGSIRARYEALGNDFRPGSNENDDILALRTTLLAEYRPEPVRIGAEVMDSRVYFDNAGTPVTSNDVNALELIQAYVGLDLRSALGKGTGTSLQLGRFTMDLGSRRLVGRNNYRNATNAFAGIRADFKAADKTSVTAFYTLPLVRLPSDKQAVLDNRVEWDRESFDLAFWGGFVSKPHLAGRADMELYFFGLNERDSPGVTTRNRQLYTPGLRISSEPAPGKTDFEFEGAYQFGTIRADTTVDAPVEDVSAYFVHAEVGRQFAGPWEPRLSLEYDLASGDHDGGSYNRFDSLYGTRRSDFGPTGIYGALGRSNISSPGVRLEVTPDKRWDGFVMYRAAWLESATDSFASTGVKDATGNAGTFAGHQVEGRMRYWIVPKLLRLDTGGAVLINGRFLKDAANANDYGNPVYGYFDLTATF